MRAVVDTNVFVAALLQGPTPRRVYNAFLQGKLKLLFSPATLAELIGILSRPTLYVLISKAEIENFLRLIQQDGIVIRPVQRFHVCRDPKDNILLECPHLGPSTLLRAES